MVIVASVFTMFDCYAYKNLCIVLFLCFQIEDFQTPWYGCERRHTLLSNGKKNALKVLRYNEGHKGELQKHLIVPKGGMGESQGDSSS